MLELIKEIRELTGAGMIDVKEALTESNGDKDKAVEILRKKGIVKLGKKSDRATKEGMVVSYIHAGGRVGVLLELNCETDFVARTPDFVSLANDLALHVAALNPLYVSRDQVPTEVIEKEKEIYMEQIKDKPEEVAAKIIEGKIEKYYQDACLLDQYYVKDDSMTVSTYIASQVAKMGENVQVKRFVRFALGN